MTTKSAVIVFVIIAVVIFVVFAFFPKTSPPTPPVTEITPPLATGKVDDLVSATFSEISDEELLIKEEENDTLLIGLDTQEISDFGQTINESEF